MVCVLSRFKSQHNGIRVVAVVVVDCTVGVDIPEVVVVAHVS